MKHDVLNYLGEKIGEIELSDSLSPEAVTAALSIYAEPPPAPPTPPNVTPRQIRQAIILSGVSLATVDSAIAALPEPHRSLAEVEWEYSTAFIRSNPLVNQVGMILGWDSAKLDALWNLASGL